jgi:hypothetical protein
MVDRPDVIARLLRWTSYGASCRLGDALMPRRRQPGGENRFMRRLRALRWPAGLQT